MSIAPRVFGIRATAVRKVAVIRRGPTDWSHVGVWDLVADIFLPGAWLHGVIYPQKCDLSADGRWLAYSAMKHPGDWAVSAVYDAVSRLPWLHTLAAWSSGTTYTRGLHFTHVGEDPGVPDFGDSEPMLAKVGLSWTQPIQFAVERRHGWRESDDAPARDRGGPWDERRRVEMVKPQPGGAAELRVEGAYAAFRAGEPDRTQAVYSLHERDDLTVLDDAQWADWDDQGDLLVATWDGVLRRIRDSESHDVVDLSLLEPDPQPAPDWAQEW